METIGWPMMTVCHDRYSIHNMYTVESHSDPYRFVGVWVRELIARRHPITIGNELRGKSATLLTFSKTEYSVGY